MATAVIENFFYAIHHQNLTVEIVPEVGDQSELITRPSTICLSGLHPSTGTLPTITRQSGTFRRMKSN